MEQDKTFEFHSTYEWEVTVIGEDGMEKGATWTFETGSPPTFKRGDTNSDGGLNLGDAISVLNYLFSGERVLTCLEAADANGDSTVNLADAVYLLNYLFAGQAAPVPPVETCGADPEPENSLTCFAFPPCE